MKPSIIVSTQDPAGMNIKKLLMDRHSFAETTETFHGHPVLAKAGIKLYTTDERTINSDGIDEHVEGDWLIFATRHQAESGKKCFCVHVPGNWADAGAGGKDRDLCMAIPSVMKEALRKIDSQYGDDEFAVALECTHHGPTLKKPCLFIEIGSKLEDWERVDTGEVIAHTVNHIIMNPVKKCKGVVVLGGGHYNQVATKLIFKTDYGVGHVCPKHMLEHLDEEMLKQAIDKNGDKFEMVVLDWKGMGTEKTRIVEMLDKLEIKYERWQRLSKEQPSVKFGI